MVGLMGVMREMGVVGAMGVSSSIDLTLCYGVL